MMRRKRLIRRAEPAVSYQLGNASPLEVYPQTRHF